MDWNSRILIDAGISAGRPVIRGTSITVESVIGLLTAGWTNAQILESYPYLSELDIRACFSYMGELLREDTSTRARTEAKVSPRISMEPMKVALRVLSAVAEKQAPSPADIEALMRLAGPKPPGSGLDEFACDALQRVMRDRAEARKAISVG